MHPRTAIREAAAAILQSAGVAHGRVESSMVRFARATYTPACGVYALSEESGAQDTSPRTYKRTLSLAVEILHRAVDDMDDALDLQAEACELALLSDPTLGGAAEDCILTKTDVTIVREGDALHGSCRLTFEVAYRTDEPAPSDLDDFRTAHADWDLDGDGAADAVDHVTLPTT